MKKTMRMALLVLLLFGLSFSVFTPKAKAAFFTETPELNQVVPLSPMMNPEYAAIVAKAERENISFDEANARIQMERAAKYIFAILAGLFVVFGAIKVASPLARGARKNIGRGIIAVDNARQKMKRTSLRSIGERLANEDNSGHS